MVCNCLLQACNPPTSQADLPQPSGRGHKQGFLQRQTSGLTGFARLLDVAFGFQSPGTDLRGELAKPGKRPAGPHAPLVPRGAGSHGRTAGFPQSLRAPEPFLPATCPAQRRRSDG